jgi:CheY-like chemotaxis protein
VALKILLADDSMTAQNMGKKILADAGYDVIAVSNGAAAIKKIASDRPDIIILDVYMPGYTGLEVCERVKGAVESSKTPVLLTVGKMEPFKPEDANRVKADGVLIKPFEATDLIAAIQNMGNRAGKTSANGSKPHETTVRVATPTESSQPETKFNLEDTQRLTPEQVRAFQDATYKDWVDKTEIPSQAAAPVPESFEPVIEHLEIERSEPRQEVPAIPAMPGFEESLTPAVADSGTISRAIGSHEIFTVESAASASPLVPELIEPEIAVNTSVIYEPKGPKDAAAESAPQPFFALDPAVESAIERHEATVAKLDPILEVQSVEIATVVPEGVAQVVKEEPIAASVPQLEMVAPEIAPVMDVVSAAAPELEINSPIHLQPEVDVQQDPALITSDDEQVVSSFVTRFGVERPEPIPVGIAAELSEEQQAALTIPMVIPQAVAVAAGAEIAPIPTSVMDEVGAIQSAPVVTSDVVAYVPGLNDTQRFVPAAILPNDSGKFAALDEIAPPDTVQVPVIVAEPEHFVADTPAPIVEELVPEISETVTIESGATAEPEIHASAADADTAAFIVPQDIALEHHSFDDSVTVAEPTISGEVAASEAAGDSELAQQLADALANQIAKEPSVEAALEPTIGVSVEPDASSEFSNSKLSDAVAKAIEKLKPQLISEILKQLTK